MTTKPTSMLHYKWAHWPCTHLEPCGQEAAASSSTQGHTTTGTAVQRTLLQLSGPYAHLRGHVREQDRFHLSFFCLPFHPDLVQHHERRTACSALLPLASVLLSPQVFASVPLSGSLQDWKLFGTKPQVPNTLRSKWDLTAALRNPAPGRPQIIRAMQHYDSEAAVLYLELFFFIHTITAGPLGPICCLS